MELTPQTLHAVEFREARRGGYNTRDVDDFLERVASGVALLQDRLRDVVARAESAEARVVELQRQLEEVHRRPRVPEASETDDTLRRTLVLAQRTADATIKEAKDEAARLLSEAREEAARVRSEVEAEARRGTEGARLAAEAEIEELISQREALRADIDVLGRHMEEQRDRIRSGISDLERVLDDPVAFRPLPEPSLSEVERPNLVSRPEAPANGPGLAMRPGPVVEPDIPGSNGTPELSSPFLPGAQVAALQEPPLPHRAPEPPRPEPALPRRPIADVVPPAPRAPFAFNGGDEAPPIPASPWPSELRTSVASDEALNLPGGEPAVPPPPNGTAEAVGIEPGSRPSEWGKSIFQRDDESDPNSTRLGPH